MDSLPFITASVVAFIFANVSDWLITTGKLTITHTRKLASHICLLGTALGFVALGFVGCDLIMAEVAIVSAVTTNAFSMCAYQVRTLEMTESSNGG